MSILVLLMFHSTNVQAQEETQLIIDGNMTIELSELDNRTIILRDNAYLKINNVHMETIFNRSYSTIKLQVYDDANLEIINSTLPATVSLYNSSSVSIVNSTVFHASWCSVSHGFHNGSGIFARGFSDFKIRDSKIGYIRAYENNSGNVFGTSVMELGSTSVGIETNIVIDVENSTIGRVHLTEPEKKLSNIKKGFHEDLLFDQKVGTEIQLYNSELRDGLSVYFRDRDLEIIDCDIYVLNTVNCSQVELTDSNVMILTLSHTERVELENCNVTGFYIRSESDLELTLNHTHIERYDVDILNSYKLFARDSAIDVFYQGKRVEMELYGVDVAFQERDMERLSMVGEFNLENNTLPVLVSQVYLNTNMTVDRVFPVIVQNLNVPVEDALVEVLDDDEVVYRTYTDNEGNAKVRLIFFERVRLGNHEMLRDSNVTQAYLLRVSTTNGFEYVHRLDVYSVIPILVTPEIVGELLYDGIEFQQILIVALGVVLVSIFIVWLLSPNTRT